MLKRLTTPLLLIMFSTGAQALTLGQIHVQSFINQPLKATIDLQGVKAGELSALNIKLASRSDFRNTGVEWNEKLENLRFSIIQSNKGPAIRVTSRKAVVEPFLSFVVDAKWDKGKMIKDFTLLLDPPLYSGREAAAVDVPGAASVVAGQPEQSDAIQPQQQGVPQAPPQNETAASPASSKQGPAAQRMSGSSLWQVASKVRPADATMQQTMVAIHEENPESFIRGNMNLLKKGQLLRIPSAEVIQGISGNAAVKRVAKHERAMRAGKSITSSRRLSPEIIALAAEPAEDSIQQQGSAAARQPGAVGGGRLRLDSATEGVNDGSLGGELGPGKNGLSTAAAGDDENRALRSRVAQLEEQLKVAHKLIRMKGELAQLQQLYRQIDAQNTQADIDGMELTDEQLLLLAEADPEQESLSDAEDAGAPQVEAAGGGSVQQQGSAAALIDVEPKAMETVQPLTAEVDKPVATPSSTGEDTTGKESASVEKDDAVPTSPGDAQRLSEAAAVDEGSAAIDVAFEEYAASSALKKAGQEQQSGTLPAATPTDANFEESAAISTPGEDRLAVEAPAAKRDSLIEGIDNNLLLGASGVGVVGLLLSFLLGRRGRAGGAVRNPDFQEQALVGERPGAGSMDDQRSQVVEQHRQHEAESAAHSPVADATSAKQLNQQARTPFEPPESLSLDKPHVLDPLELVKVLIRNNETRQARDVLMQAIEADPERTDLHIQLMELLHADKDRHAFETHMNQMEQSGISIDPLQWQSIERMHGDLLPAGVESPGIVNQKYSEAEIIDLDTRDTDDSESDDEHEESDLEAALRAFEMELDDNRSDELLSQAGLALDESAALQNNTVTSVIPDARVVEDLELDEDLAIDESGDTDQEREQPEVISLDDSFGIDSHISDDFDDIFTKNTVEPERQGDIPTGVEEQRLPEFEAEELSITSFDTDPSTLKQAEADAKIDLAAAFADMGDVDGARDILDEVMSEGSPQQQRAAQELLKKYL